MAKINRLPKGELPSAVSRGEIPTATGLESTFKGLSGLAQTGAEIAGDAEQREAERLRGVLEAKQAITNEVSGARIAGDYEVSLTQDSDKLKVKYAKAPEKILEEFIPLARAKAENFQKEAANGQIALDVARQSGSLIQAETRRLHNWISSQQTQNTKDDVSKMLNTAAAKARAVPTLAALVAYIPEQEAKLLPFAVKAHGDAQGRTMIRRMGSEMVQEYYYRAGLIDPKGAEATLNDGPAAAYLSTDERQSMRRYLKDVAEGRGVAQFEQLAVETAKRNLDIYKSLLDESLDGTTILSMRRENATNQERLEKDPTLDDKQRAEQLGLLKKRVEFLDYATKIYRKRIPTEIADSPDAITAQAEIAEEFEALFKNPDDDEDGDTAKSNLARVLTLQHKAAALALDKKLGGAQFSTIMKAVSKVASEGVQTEEKNTWSLGFKWAPPFIGITQTAQQAGNERLRDLFEAGEYREVPQSVRNAAWFQYQDRFNAASEDADVSVKQAQAMAQASIDAAIARSRKRPK